MGSKEQGAHDTKGRWLVIPRTLCFVFNGDDVLLMKRGAHKRIFPNQYNGLGGHIERFEDPLAGAIREIKEESGLDVTDIHLSGIHSIDSGDTHGIVLFVFKAQTDDRNILPEGEEGTLHWVNIHEIDQLDVVEDLPSILNRLMTGTSSEPYFLHISYNAQDQIQMRETQVNNADG
ncbi:hypothetical protein MASR2M15_20080 [Anaerolineales bacterium]